jgi:hypothetical protein
MDHYGIVNVSITETKYNDQLTLNRTSVLFLTISFVILMIISLVWLIFYYFQRFRYLQTKDRQSKQIGNAAKRIISKIPTKKIKADEVCCCFSLLSNQ